MLLLANTLGRRPPLLRVGSDMAPCTIIAMSAEGHRVAPPIRQQSNMWLSDDPVTRFVLTIVEPNIAPSLISLAPKEDEQDPSSPPQGQFNISDPKNDIF